tara:strand:- start:558 stop:671 length:114 start_codon:yes stop_codon:yes gene_type:complete
MRDKPSSNRAAIKATRRRYRNRLTGKIVYTHHTLLII